LFISVLKASNQVENIKKVLSLIHETNEGVKKNIKVSVVEVIFL